MKDIKWYKFLPIYIDGWILNVNAISFIIFCALLGWLFESLSRG